MNFRVCERCGEEMSLLMPKWKEIIDSIVYIKIPFTNFVVSLFREIEEEYLCPCIEDDLEHKRYMEIYETGYTDGVDSTIKGGTDDEL